MKKLILVILLLGSSLANAAELNFAAYHDNKTRETIYSPVKIVFDLDNGILQIQFLQSGEFYYYRICHVEENEGDLVLFCKGMKSDKEVLVVLHRTYTDIQVYFYSELDELIFYENQN